MDINNLEFLFFVYTYTYFSGYRIIPEIIVRLNNNIKFLWCNFRYPSSKWSHRYTNAVHRDRQRIYVYAENFAKYIAHDYFVIHELLYRNLMTWKIGDSFGCNEHATFFAKCKTLDDNFCSWRFKNMLRVTSNFYHVKVQQSEMVRFNNFLQYRTA